MSQIPLSHKIERTCEGCDKKVVYEMVNPSEQSMEEMTTWFTVIREAIDPETGRPFKMLVQACSIACVGPAALKLIIPESTSDGIDMNSLRAGNVDEAN